jgi:DNA repair protein RadC
MNALFLHLAHLSFEQSEYVLIGQDSDVLAHLRYSDRLDDRVYPPLREIVAKALSCGATALVMAHNHSGQISKPSAQDIRFTRRLVNVLHPIGIQVRDHLIVTKDSVFSFRQAGLL